LISRELLDLLLGIPLESCKQLQILPDSEPDDQRVGLRAVAYHVAHLVWVAVECLDLFASDLNSSISQLFLRGQALEGGTLACAINSKEDEAFVLAKTERDVLDSLNIIIVCLILLDDILEASEPEFLLVATSFWLFEILFQVFN